MTDFAEVKISQFSPVPGKPVSKIINSKKSLHAAPTSPIVLPRYGGVAQLGERLTGSQEVRGSIPLVSTIVHARPLNRVAFLFLNSQSPIWGLASVVRVRNHHIDACLQVGDYASTSCLLQKVHNQRDHRFLFFRSRLSNHERNSNKRAVCDSFV